MNKIEKQILQNQINIMIWISEGDHTKGYFANNIDNSNELVHPTKQEKAYEQSFTH